MSNTGLPLGLPLPQENDSSSSRLDHNQQEAMMTPKHKKSTSKVEQDDDQESEDLGHPGRAKPVLTEEQKKANHIYSEQKRREKIREQYDKLAELTPGMEGHGRSEGRVLEEAVKFAQGLKEERARLIQSIEARGGIVPPELKKT